MSLFVFLSSPELRLFTVSFGLVLGFLVLELLASLGGWSLFGDTASADAPDLDGPDLDVVDADAFELESADLSADHGGPSSIASGLLSWLGVGRAPFLVWLACFLTGFALAGYALQLGIVAVFGAPAPAAPVAMLALPVGLTTAAQAARLVARLLPRVQSSAISRRQLGGRVGTVTGGVARRGRPAEAKVTDRHGNAHYIRVEPFDDHDEIGPGEDVVVLSPTRRRDGDGPLIHRALRLGDIERTRAELRTAKL